MVQKYIAALLVLTVLGLTSPCLAGDFVNMRPLLQMQLMSTKPIAQRATLGGMAGSVAFAPPQTPQNGQPQQSTKSGSGELTTKGKIFAWVGAGLIAEGGFDAAYGAAILSDPCKGLSSSYCTSNYSSIRGVYFGAAAAVAAIGVIFLIKGLHSRQ